MFGDYLGTNAQDSAAIVAAYRKHDTASPHWKDVDADPAGQPAELCRARPRRRR